LVVSWRRPTPTPRAVSGGGPPLKFHETRDNLPQPAGTYIPSRAAGLDSMLSSVSKSIIRPSAAFLSRLRWLSVARSRHSTVAR